jgi:hypothetical protein
MSKPDSAVPYSLFEGNGGGFLILELPAGRIALPYIGLRQITYSEEAGGIALEFTEQSIEVHGKGLGQLFELLATARVKALRVGCEEKGPCKIEKLVALDG